ncbi:MAG: DevR family CRISPR-associated autoregulator [Candidatus Saccharicenans sp.]|nr:DevR family CRISPR-associated autoregulator [Candidatus Saccharicenans sp.]
MAIFEIGILARITWNLHSLNNEGTVGNVTEPRTVVLANGEKTDGISGEMLKHIHAYNVWLLQEDKSLFCSACQKFHPQRADLITDRTNKPGVAMKTAISSCILCDLHGFLVQRPSIGRPSTVEFGWALGIPDKTHRDIHIHARHSMVGRSREEAKTESEEQEAKTEVKEAKVEEKQVTAQMIYHRPTRSGIYALISIFQPWRIGLNEIDYQYVIEESDRKLRFQLALNAYKASLIRTDGAMTSTRLPHVEGIEGALVISEKNFPVPVVSPLTETYVTQTEELVNRERGLSIKKFSNQAQFNSLIDELLSEEIYKLNMP